MKRCVVIIDLPEVSGFKVLDADTQEKLIGGADASLTHLINKIEENDWEILHREKEGKKFKYVEKAPGSFGWEE